MQLRFWFAGTVAATALVLAGCGGGDQPHHRDRDEAMGNPPAPRAVMHGAQTYFGGKLTVEASLGQGLGRGPAKGGGGDEGGGGGGGGSGYLGGGIRESSMPPVTLRLHLTNTGDVPFEVTFNACDSALGNFVVTPEKLTLAAGHSADSDPMRSLLGVTSDEIPIELSIAVAGKNEKKTLTLHLDQPAPTMMEAPPSAPAPAAPIVPPPAG